MQAAGAGAALLLSACVSVPAPAAAPAAGATPFDVAAFFAGTSRGEGVLRVTGRAPVAIRVASSGRLEPDGTLRLDQTIREGTKPTRTRQWRLRPVAGAPGRWAGTLSDAEGPVAAVAEPGRLTIRYRAKGGLAIRQLLTLTPDGRAADNVLVARLAGLPVAALRERIERMEE